MLRARVLLPPVAQEFLRTADGRWCRSTLTIFHRWMGERNLALSDLTPTHLEQFWQEQEQKKLAPSTWRAYRCRVHKYLYWLDQKGLLRITIDPPLLRHMRAPLPAPARRFLARDENQRHAPIVRNLHDWLHRKRIALSELTPAHLKAFVRQPIATPIAHDTRERIHRRIEPYMLWLHDQGLVPFRDTRDVHKPFPLPDTARGYIDTLRPVRKAATCHGYAADLRDIHAWLDAQGFSLEALNRGISERWLKALADRGLAPTSRYHRVLNVRSYLWWLVERL